jgi:hypothetical protein
MSERFVNIDRDTPMLFPVDMREKLSEDHLIKLKNPLALQVVMYFGLCL